MKYELNDRDLDDLIMASVERSEKLETLNRAIVKEVRRKARHEWVLRWAHIVAFSFGMPLLILIFAAGIYAVCRIESLQMWRYILFIPVMTMSYLLWREMRNFSIAEV